MQSEVERLENEAATPDLWNDPENAQRVTSALSRVQGTLNKVRQLRGRVTDLPVMIKLANAESNVSAQSDIIKELDSLSSAINDLEVQTLLSGEYDPNWDCCFLPE